MVDAEKLRREFSDYFDYFEREAKTVYSEVVLPRRSSPEWSRGLPGTLYGYMMWCFAHIDLLSAYVEGSDANPTARMEKFVRNYLSKSPMETKVAIKVWRHKLMHTGQPRPVRVSGKSYIWLLHWGEWLPKEQHFSFTETRDGGILKLALFYLLEDLRNGASKYFDDLSKSPQLQANFQRLERSLSREQPKTWHQVSPFP